MTQNTEATPAFWSTEDAVLALSRGLADVERLEGEKSRYSYQYPPQLMDDLRDAAGRVRDAVRYLLSEDADA